MRERLTFKGTAVDGTKVNLQKAMRIKIAKDSPGEAWHEVNIGQWGTVGSVHLKSLYGGRCTITSAKLKDLRNLYSYIPVEYCSFYTVLQTTTPSLWKLRVVVLS